MGSYVGRVLRGALCVVRHNNIAVALRDYGVRDERSNGPRRRVRPPKTFRNAEGALHPAEWLMSEKFESPPPQRGCRGDKVDYDRRWRTAVIVPSSSAVFSPLSEVLDLGVLPPKGIKSDFPRGKHDDGTVIVRSKNKIVFATSHRLLRKIVEMNNVWSLSNSIWRR